MRWLDLAFFHWPVASSSLVRLLPAGLRLDTYDGSAWIGVVPFRMEAVHPRFTPFSSRFAELNVRTYVTCEDKPGVWFFSLDAASRLAVRAARRTFCLPYFDADMAVQRSGDVIRYRSRRTHRGAAAAELDADYAPLGAPQRSPRGSLEEWLTERYCLYAVDRRDRAWRGEIHHRAWPLQRAEAEIRTNTLTDWLHVRLPATAPLCHFASRLDVVAWAPTRCGRNQNR